jgi:D-inositol-3-phosphate glycosyltransferase
MHLDVVGDGPDAGALHALAAQLGIAHRVAWHGQQPRDAMPAFYAQASATLVPSRDEGFGMVAAESLLCETPVIATDAGGLPDIVRDGRRRYSPWCRSRSVAPHSAPPDASPC